MNEDRKHYGGDEQTMASEGGRKDLERRAWRILDNAPRPLPGEGLTEYTRRGHDTAMERAKREGGPELAQEVLRLMGEHARCQRDAEAEGIVRTIPSLPRPEDRRRVQERKVLAWRKWIGRVGTRVAGDAELSDRVEEAMLTRMGLSEGDPERAARNARDLLQCGMGEVGLTTGAAEVLSREGLRASDVSDYLVDEYVRVWKERGEETPVAAEIGDEMLVVGKRDAIRVNVWLHGEPGTPPVTGEIREGNL